MHQLKLIYFDPECTGYHLGHVRLFAERAAVDSRIASAHFVLSPEFLAHDKANILELIQSNARLSFELCSRSVAEACKPHSGLRAREKGRIRWSEVRRLLQDRPGSILFDSMFDLNIRGAALDRRPLNGFVTGIVHFCAPALLSKRTKEKWHLRIAYLLAKRRETPFVFSFDKMFIEKGPRYIVNNWRWVPDPLPVNREQLQRLLLASPSSGKDHVEFLLFGSLGRRKGLFSVLEALERLALSTAKRVSVRILGEYSEGGTNEREHFLEIISRIQSKGIVGLRFEERFATEDELIEALIDCDVVLAPYLHHSGVSAALIWAAAAGRPIITQDSGWIAHETSTNKLGLMCDPTDSVKLASAIAQMVNQEDRRNLWPPDRLHKFAEMHTPDHFYSSIIEQLVLFE